MCGSTGGRRREPARGDRGFGKGDAEKPQGRAVPRAAQATLRGQRDDIGSHFFPGCYQPARASVLVIVRSTRPGSRRGGRWSIPGATISSQFRIRAAASRLAWISGG